MANTSLHIKRIQQEIKDFQNNPSDTFHAEPLKEEIHVWHFTIKGPPDTEFEGGIYHGKIELPFDYPLKPPALYFLTPSGRYETNTKICLTITDYHPEHWNPGWTIKTMLKALISYFPEKEKVLGVGGLDFPPEERKRLALISKKWECPQCGPIKDIIKERDPEEKKVEEEAEKAKHKKRQQEEEVSVELASAAGRENEEVNIPKEAEKTQEIVAEKPKEEEGEWEDEKEETKEQVIPGKKEGFAEIKEKKRNSGVSLEELFKERLNKRTIEVGLENLQSIMMQHIMYYETKRSVKYEKNVLNVEKTNNEQTQKAREDNAAQRREEEKQREEAIENFGEDWMKEGVVEGEGNIEEDGEVIQRQVEKKQIKKQLNIINLLIIALLLGAVAVGVFM